MFVVKLLSMCLSSVMLINSTMIYTKPVVVDEQIPVVSEPVQIVEEIVEPETPIEVVVGEVVSEPEPELEPEPEASEALIESTTSIFTDAEIDLIALVTMAEAEGEPEEGKRLVIDVILNRYDSSRFPNTIEGVLYAKNAFECLQNGRADRCYVRDDIRQLVLEEIESRTNDHIHYFRADHYHSFGKPVVQVGNHYFSTY